MATNYTVLSGLTTTELVGTAQTQDVELYTVQAQPSGVVFYVRLLILPGYAEFDQVIFDSLAANLADLYNRIAALAHVVGVSMYEDITPSNQITDRLVLTISSTSGRSTITLDDPTFNLDPSYMQGVVNDVVARLDAIEAS